jgi:hypothetical protein
MTAEDDRTLEAVQDALKPGFADAGLMLGEFHPRHDRPGLHNPTFRPLVAPLHLLVVRELVRADLRFLDHPRYPRKKVERFLAAYRRKFDI